MSLEVGDKVRISEELVAGEEFGGVHIYDSMAECGGELAVIDLIDRERGAVYLKPVEETSENVDVFWWFPITGVSLYKYKGEDKMNINVGDKVRIRGDLEFGEGYGDKFCDRKIEDNQGEFVTVKRFKDWEDAFYVEEFPETTAITPEMVAEVVNPNRKIDTGKEVYSKAIAKQGELVKIDYAKIVYIKERDLVMYHVEDFLGEVVKRYKESDVVDRETAKELAKDYHKDRIAELEKLS